MSLTSARSLARLRLALCSSAGIASLIIGGVARAEDAPRADLTGDYLEPHSSITSPLLSVIPQSQSGMTQPSYIAPEPQVVIANPNTPTTARDPVNITGVGQMVVDQQNGFIGLCTGTLINPRTVLFAAHCVNSRAAADYGAATGGTPISFGFQTNNSAAWRAWIASGYKTNVADFLYNVNQVTYNPLSLEPAANSFLYGDVALASLDTPAKGIPTWALLFSALPARPITAATGAGYHVTIDGYGNNGTGTTGSTGGIDFRRRIAENFIGGLASIDEFQNFLFGTNGTANPQNLYWIDFDDPRRGTAAADPRDFNAWRDNAVANGKEGITASGDSGGPLILDQTFAKQLVIGVLSGGYTRFFNGQPPNGYGTASFYQPLYVYWDWIAANNPYRYVGSVAGNGNWNDANHWVTNIDPNYNIIGANGQLVNGVPTTAGVGNQDEPGWGQACEPAGGGTTNCLDIANGTETRMPIGTAGDANGNGAQLSNGMGVVSIASLNGGDGTATSAASLDPTAPTAQAVIRPTPAPTIANGLPGATGFVPNNTNGNRLTNTPARYFDVTLAAAGTTTLSSAVTIDQLNIAGGSAVLDITSAGSLTSLMGVNQMTGTVQVNGRLITQGDYLLMSGGLNGTGTITAPFFNNVMGVISPGTSTTIGTLTFQGNLILNSASIYQANIGANGTSDLIAVTATTFGANNAPTNGIANVGGSVVFSGIAGTPLIAGSTYTILTAQGGVTGRFNAASPLSAILTPTFIYNPTSVQARITAGLYANVVSRTSPVQVAYAQLLDQNRAVNQGVLSALYTPLDQQNAATIQSTLESLAPRTEALKDQIGTVALDNMARFYRERVNLLQPGRVGTGSLAVTGEPLKLAAMNLNALPGQEPVRTDAGDTLVTEGVLPETVSAFLAGGYLEGKGRGMATAIPFAGRNSFDGYYVAGGIEVEAGEGGALGFGLSYTDIDGDTAVPNQNAKGQLYQGTIYGKLEAGPVVLDSVFSAGLLDVKTRRDATIVGTPYTLRSKSGSLALSSEVGVGVNATLGSIKVGPRAAFRASRITFDNVRETGGGPALTYFRENLNSLQGRVGATLGGGVRFRPFASGYYVHDFADRPAAFGANFVGGVGPQAVFALTGQDKDWYEVGGGLAFGSEKVEFSVSADTTLDRKDVKNQSYRGSVKIRF